MRRVAATPTASRLRIAVVAVVAIVRGGRVHAHGYGMRLAVLQRMVDQSGATAVAEIKVLLLEQHLEVAAARDRLLLDTQWGESRIEWQLRVGRGITAGSSMMVVRIEGVVVREGVRRRWCRKTAR